MSFSFPTILKSKRRRHFWKWIQFHFLHCQYSLKTGTCITPVQNFADEVRKLSHLPVLRCCLVMIQSYMDTVWIRNQDREKEVELTRPSYLFHSKKPFWMHPSKRSRNSQNFSNVLSKNVNNRNVTYWIYGFSYILDTMLLQDEQKL